MVHEFIPAFVRDALRDVEQRQIADMYDRETVLMFAAVLGHEDAAEWLALRRYLYFEALARSRRPVAASFA